MRRVLLSALLITSAATAYAQPTQTYYVNGNMSVGRGRTFPDTTSWIHIGPDSSKKGVLMPKALASDITTPNRGMFFYSIPDSVLYHADGTKKVRYMTYKDTALIRTMIGSGGGGGDMSAYIKHGGDTRGMADSIGTKDNYGLVFKTNNTPRYVVSNSGAHNLLGLKPTSTGTQASVTLGAAPGGISFGASGTWTQLGIGSGYIANNSFAPSSGTMGYTGIELNQTLNTTGTWAGAIKGLYINLTATSTTGATSVRAIETNRGDWLHNLGRVSLNGGAISHVSGTMSSTVGIARGATDISALVITGNSQVGAKDPYATKSQISLVQSGDSTNSLYINNNFMSSIDASLFNGRSAAISIFGNGRLGIYRTQLAQSSLLSVAYVAAASTEVNVTNASSIGFRSGAENTVSSNFANVTDFQATPSLFSTTNITNRYGLAILYTGTGITNPWGVYQTAADVKNHFNGNTSFGTTSNTAKVDINGANGYNQLRLRNSYTPTSTADTNGNTGDVSWDSNYIYIKTSAGWKRSALTTF